MKRTLELDTESAPPAGRPRLAVNPYTGRPYSQKYYDILAKREGAWLRGCVRGAGPAWACSERAHAPRRAACSAPHALLPPLPPAAQACPCGRPRRSLAR